MIILIFSHLTFCAHTSHAPYTGDIGGDSWAGASLRRRELFVLVKLQIPLKTTIIGVILSCMIRRGLNAATVASP